MAVAEKTGEKRLWGTPLKLKQAEDRIVELEEALAAAGGEIPPKGAAKADDYEFEVWRRDRATEKPVHWRHFHADGSEWVYHEKQNFMHDSGYGTFIDDRVAAMVKNAFRSLKNPGLYFERFGPEVRTANGQPTGTSDYSKLPKFNPEERVIEVIVRIR